MRWWINTALSDRHAAIVTLYANAYALACLVCTVLRLGSQRAKRVVKKIGIDSYRKAIEGFSKKLGTLCGLQPVTDAVHRTQKRLEAERSSFSIRHDTLPNVLNLRRARTPSISGHLRLS
jgi:hypothetical protein